MSQHQSRKASILVIVQTIIGESDICMEPFHFVMRAARKVSTNPFPLKLSDIHPNKKYSRVVKKPGNK